MCFCTAAGAVCLFPSFELQYHVSRIIYAHAHRADILRNESFPLLRAHLHPGRAQRLVQHIVYVQPYGFFYIPIQLLKYCPKLYVLGIAGIKIIYLAVKNARTRKRLFKIRPAMRPFYHHKEACVRQRRYHAPVVRIARYQYERIHIVSVMLQACA